MMRVHSSTGLAGGFTLAMLLAFAVFLPGPAMAMQGSGDLSPRLAKLASPALRGASNAEQARRLGLVARGPGSLLRRGSRVLVYVRFDHGALARISDLRAAGARAEGASLHYQTDTVAIDPSQLPSLTTIPGVESVAPAFTPIVSSVGPTASSTPYVPCFGADTSEGDMQVGAARARAEFEVAGTGTTVGILSDSFNRDPFSPTGADEDVASGDLPGPSNPCGDSTVPEILDDAESQGEDEGRAMAQIVHDLAPGAKISFATAFTGESNFADNIRALASDGARTIVDDVSYLEEPFFQEGPVGVAIGEVAEDEGVAYFSSAGNDNLLDSEENEIGSWEAPEFRDSESCPTAVVALGPGLNPNHCMNFDPNTGEPPDRTFRITVEPEEALTIDLQWAEPWEGVTSDLDAYLLDANGQLIAASTEKNTTPKGQPLEVIGWENETAADAKVRLVINRRSGTGARLKFVLVQNGGGVSDVEYDKSSEEDVVGPTIFGHNGGAHTMSIGAIRFNTNAEPEFFSSRGPVTHYFGPVTGTGAAPPLGGAEVLSKPDLVATDGGANTFFGVCAEKAWRFFGTSAAAPHAAAVAALEREAATSASAAAIEDAQRSAALEVGSFPEAAVGAGLLNAPGALEELGVAPVNPGATVAEPPLPGACLPPRKPGTSSQGTSTPAPIGPPSDAAKRHRLPRTFFVQRPRKVLRTSHRRARAVFLFGSNEADVSFVCRVDGGLFRPCPRRFVRRFPVGRHSVRVAARDSEGIGDKTPAVYRFKVKRSGG